MSKQKTAQECITKLRKTINDQWGYVSGHHNIGASALEAGLVFADITEKLLAVALIRGVDEKMIDKLFNMWCGENDDEGL